LNIQDNDGNSALHEAVRTDAADAVCLLLQLGADCTLVDTQQYAPLHVAAQLEKVRTLESMARFIAQIDSNIRGKHGRTPLHLAAIHDKPRSVQILVRIHPGLNLPCPFWFPLIHVQSKRS
jgi:transient receptor potential cation channel subfamily A protein 1